MYNPLSLKLHQKAVYARIGSSHDKKLLELLTDLEEEYDYLNAAYDEHHHNRAMNEIRMTVFRLNDLYQKLDCLEEQK